MADEEITESEFKSLAARLEGAYGGAKVIQVAGNPRAVIVKTTVGTARQFREPGRSPVIGGKRLVPVLTSGAIGNLKRRANEAGT